MADGLNPIKPGWKTSEFWKSALVTIFGLVMASGAIHVPDTGPWAQVFGMVSAAVASAAYSASRGSAKS